MTDADASIPPSTADTLRTELSRLGKEVRSVRTFADARVTSLELNHADRFFRLERLFDTIVADQRRLDQRLDLLERARLPSRLRRVEELLGIDHRA